VECNKNNPNSRLAFFLYSLIRSSINKSTSMRLLIWLIVFVVCFQSCNNTPEQKEPFKTMLADCDEVNINFYNGGDTIKFDTKDSLGVKVLGESVSGNTETIKDACQPAGQLFYRAKGDTLFRAEFAISNVAADQCNYITYTHQGKAYKNKLHDKAHQLLTQIYPKPTADSIATTPVDTAQ
jgi:hypothetical protein